MEPPKPLGDLLTEGEVRLSACGIEQPRLEAEVMMAHALRIDRGRLAMMLSGGRGVPAGGPIVEVPAAIAFRRMVKRRGLREPLAYITGQREFWSLEFEVSPAVLIPRPETEILVQEALTALPDAPGGLVVDVGTGSGAVAIALATERPASAIIATDISREALEVARRNVSRHRVESRVRLMLGDLLAPLRRHDAGDARFMDARFMMVVSNPPYVGLEERASLMPEVRDWEPAEALYSGEQGMDIIERLAPQAAGLLLPEGWLMLEVAAPRAAAVVRLLESSGFWQDVRVRNDYAGLPRVVRARRSGS